MMVTYIAANENSGRLQKIAFKEAPVGRVAATQPHNVSYTFDDAGNPTKGVVDTGTTTIYSPNHRNQYDSVGTDSVSNGNFHEMNSYQAVTYDYINDAHLDKVTDISGNNYTLTYDAPPGQTPILEYYRYDVFGQPAIYGPDNQVRQASLYSNRFLFTGREYNANFGFYEYRVRAYHPSLGCFMSEDPKLFDPGDYNLFRYCHNDPVDNVDPMGSADEKREPWYNHQEQAKELGKLQALLNQKLLLGYGAISLGGLQYALTQLQQTMGDTANFHMAQMTKQGADTKTFGSWQDAGRAGATQALALAAADPNHREWNFDIGQSESDAKAFTFSQARRGSYEYVNDGVHRPGWYNTSLINAKTNLPE